MGVPRLPAPHHEQPGAGGVHRPGFGQANFQLLAGVYYFRTTYNGRQFWSDSVCTVTETSTSCTSKTIHLTQPVRAYHRSSTVGASLTTGASGVVTFTLAANSYWFKVDGDGITFTSGSENHCVVSSGFPSARSSAGITVTHPVSVSVWNETTNEFVSGLT